MDNIWTMIADKAQQETDPSDSLKTIRIRSILDLVMKMKVQQFPKEAYLILWLP